MSFELNIAVLPNSVLYLDGCQLSYIKVYVHIFNLWNSNKPCFITNDEFCKRTKLHKDTVIGAITFFEKHGVLKRVQKGRRRFLVQTAQYIETDSEPVDNSEINSSNNNHGSELDLQRVGVRPSEGSELDRNNIKYNNKANKSFCVSHEEPKKAESKATAKEATTLNNRILDNRAKPSWADNQKSPFANVERQSTSFEVTKNIKREDNVSPLLAEFIKNQHA